MGRGRIKGVETTTITNDLVRQDTVVNRGFQLIRVSHITEEVKAHLIITDGMVVTGRKVGTVMIERVADIAVVTIETVAIDAVGRGAEVGATAVAEAQALNIGDAAVVAGLEIDLDAIVIQGVARHTVIRVVNTTQVGLTE